MCVFFFLTYSPSFMFGIPVFVCFFGVWFFEISSNIGTHCWIFYGIERDFSAHRARRIFAYFSPIVNTLAVESVSTFHRFDDVGIGEFF